MPRKENAINNKHLNRLKKALLQKSNVKLLRSVDCNKLADEVLRETSIYINGITFKRIFGFVKYPFKPSIQTLNILSNYIGYKSWYDFELSINGNHPISNDELEILLSFYDFDYINNIEFHDGGIQSMSRKIALRFRQDVATFKKAIPALSKKKFAQIFFIEHFPDYDNLCIYYHLIYTEYLKQTKRKEALLFANCMLFLKSFWKIDKKNCKKYFKSVIEIKISNKIHPFLIGRYFATRILYEHFYGDNNIQTLIQEYLSLRNELPKNGNHFHDFPASEYIISEALLHVKAYNKCIEIVELAFRDFPLKMEFVKKGYYRQLNLFWLIAKKTINPQFEIENNLSKIDIENFYFISKKYFSILFYYAKWLSDKSSKNLNEAKQIAIEIENKYLEKIFLNVKP